MNEHVDATNAVASIAWNVHTTTDSPMTFISATLSNIPRTQLYKRSLACLMETNICGTRESRRNIYGTISRMSWRTVASSFRVGSHIQMRLQYHSWVSWLAYNGTLHVTSVNVVKLRWIRCSLVALIEYYNSV